MGAVEPSNPPRNGEGDRSAKPSGGGADGVGVDPSVSPDGAPPPRSGEDRKRVRHRTVGASEENIRLARKLRRSMSLPEVLLWNFLRTHPHGLKFRKQHPVRGYVADFACLERRLLIEIDGESHNHGNRPRHDATRDRLLAALGYETLRIPAVEVLKNMEGVMPYILNACENRPLHHDAPRRGPPPRSGEELR